MKLGLLSLLLLIVSPGYAVAAPSQTDVVGSYIAAHARRMKADEYAEARKVVEGDLNGDKIPDTAVLYTIEGMGGGNSHAQYIAVFLGRKAGKPQFVSVAGVGGKTNRSVELQRVAGGKILIATKSFRSSDPSCCPSIPGKATYRLAGKRLVEGR
jgi:hypothetical protein